jgi:hypothetical protein
MTSTSIPSVRNGCGSQGRRAGEELLDGDDLAVGDCLGSALHPHDIGDARRIQNLEASTGRERREAVAGKERHLDLLAAILPLRPALMERKEDFQAARRELVADFFS